jgi:hypothetical protein
VVTAEPARAAREIRLPAGSTTFVEGDAGDAAYLVQWGLVDLMAGGVDFHSRTVTLVPGEVEAFHLSPQLGIVARLERLQSGFD